MKVKGRILYGPKGVGRPRIFQKRRTEPTGAHQYGDDWPQISAEVRKRDNYQCMAHKIGLPPCKNRFPPPLHHLLHCHHIHRWAKSKNNAMKNLITVCVTCHGKEHGRSVGRDPTAKQMRFAKNLKY